MSSSFTSSFVGAGGLGAHWSIHDLTGSDLVGLGGGSSASRFTSVLTGGGDFNNAGGSLRDPGVDIRGIFLCSTL